MYKKIFITLLGLSLFTAANAQSGGLIYYLKNSGKLVSKDSADYTMVVFPPDTSGDTKLFRVSEYYPNGKPRLITGSKTNDIRLRYQGHYIAYFPNGKKRKIGNYEDGEPVGHEVDYYPNGHFYSSKDYIDAKKVLLKDCRDSTGNVLAENGNGKWIQFEQDFKNIDSWGVIKEGLKVGRWHGTVYEYETISEYINGELNSLDIISKLNGELIDINKEPEYPGGKEALVKFIWLNTNYPLLAREQGIKGIVTISFMVEIDGTLTDFIVTKGVADILNYECLRVIKLSPPWIPGFKNGHAIRLIHSLPIAFSLSE
ncbi:energy transducer TonB [Mucilaginibacter sp.]|uniref:energy transducer TonB n=1 Tax=Mucilaginibacter sp. TaxID=1882438 RepID=UPI003D10E430